MNANDFYFAYRAAASDSSDAIKTLAAAGAELDAQTSNGSAPLHTAAASGGMTMQLDNLLSLIILIILDYLRLF